MVVAVGSRNFENAIAQLKNGNVERTAAQVEDQNLFVLVHLVKAVSQSSSRRLVHNTQNFQASNLASILRCLTLSVVEISRNGDDSLSDGLAQTLFSIVLHLLKHHCGNLFRRVFLAVNVDNRTAALTRNNLVRNGLLLFLGFVVGTTDETLYRRNRVVGIGNCLVLCSLTYHTLTVFTEALNRRGGTIAFRIDQDFRRVAFHNCHRGIGSTQVNTENLCHCYQSFH